MSIYVVMWLTYKLWMWVVGWKEPLTVKFADGGNKKKTQRQWVDRTDVSNQQLNQKVRPNKVNKLDDETFPTEGKKSAFIYFLFSSYRDIFFPSLLAYF